MDLIFKEDTKLGGDEEGEMKSRKSLEAEWEDCEMLKIHCIKLSKNCWK